MLHILHALAIVVPATVVNPGARDHAVLQDQICVDVILVLPEANGLM